eukprot:2946582-Pleurochrysis_carterae.AAC.1
MAFADLFIWKFVKGRIDTPRSVSPKHRTHLQPSDNEAWDLGCSSALLIAQAYEQLELLHAKRSKQDPNWFNMAANYSAATAVALSTQDEIFTILGDRETWEEEAGAETTRGDVHLAAAQAQPHCQNSTTWTLASVSGIVRLTPDTSWVSTSC